MDNYSYLLNLVVDIAAHTPLKGGQHVHAAMVPWSTIRALRDALDACEIDWRREAMRYYKGG